MSRPEPPRALVAIEDSSIAMETARLLTARDWQVGIAGRDVVLSALSAARHTVAVLDHRPLDASLAELLAACACFADAPRLLVLCEPGEVYQLLHASARPRAYACRPVAPKEIAAKLEALARGTGSNLDACLSAGGIALDPLARRVYLPGQCLMLPKREFDLLHLLMTRAGKVVTREESTRHLYRWGQDIGSNAVDVHIHSLRRRFSPGLIRTVRGEGYILE